MTDREPDSLSGQSCQQLRYYQIRGEKWLLKLKLLILAVLCVLLGAFLVAFQVQDIHGSISHKENTKVKDDLIKQLQTNNTNLSSDVKVKDELIKQLHISNTNLSSDVKEKEMIIQQFQTEKNKQTRDHQYQCVGDGCCARGWKYFSGKCYYVSTDEKTWTESRDACVAAGGHLVIINNKEEQDFLRRSVPGGGEQQYWVGLTDAVKEGDWRWLDGTRLSETPKLWTGTEPDNWSGTNQQFPEGEDCALICLDYNCYGLLDGFCNVQEKKLKHVCEAKAVN